MFDPILKGLGTFLAWIDSWSGNYMIALLLFALILELLFLPFGIKQQKNSIRQAKLRPKEMAIRKRYAGRNDRVTQQKVAMEIQELYKQENYSQFSGCLPMILQLVAIMLIYQVVINPLLYVVKLDPATIKALTDTSTETGKAIAEALAGAGNTGTIELLNVIKEKGLEFFMQSDLAPEVVADLEAAFLGNRFPDFTVLGGRLNLAGTPALKWNALLSIPIITFVVYFASTKLTRKLTYQPMAADQQTGCSYKVMDIVMPLFSLFIAFRVPAAIGLYWVFKSILGTIKQFILFKAMPLPKFTDEDYKAAEREYKGKAPIPEREIPENAHSYCKEDEDDDEPYPTFVGVKGGRYDDESEDKPAETNEETKSDKKIGSRLEVAPLKDEKTEEPAEKAEKTEETEETEETTENKED